MGVDWGGGYHVLCGLPLEIMRIISKWLAMDPGFACGGRLRRGIPCIMWPAQEIMRIISKWLVNPRSTVAWHVQGEARGDRIPFVTFIGNSENH